MSEVGYILFGWGLGLVSTLFVSLARNHGRKMRFQQGLSVELREAMPFLTGMHYLLKCRLGQVDRDTLKWTHSMFSRFSPDDVKIVQSLEKSMKKPDGELEKDLALRYNESRGKSVGLSKLTLPFLKQNLSSVSLLTPETQRIVAQIQRDFRTLNQQIGDYAYWSRKTFDSNLTPNNQSILKSNVAGVSQAIAKLSYRTAELMLRLVSSLGN